MTQSATAEPARAAGKQVGPLDPGDHMAVLNSVSEALSQTLHPMELLDFALGKTLEALGVECGVITLVDKETHDWVFKARQGWRHQDLVGNGERIKADNGLWDLVGQTGRIVVYDDVANDPRLVLPQNLDEGVKAMALAPLQAHNSVLGVLGVMSRHPHEFSQQDQRFLAAIADRIGLALDNSRLYFRIQRLTQEQSALHEIATATQGVLSLQTVMEQGLRALLALFELDTAAIHFVDNQKRLTQPPCSKKRRMATSRIRL